MPTQVSTSAPRHPARRFTAWYRRWDRRTQRLIAVGSGLTLVAVPTLWTIFPSLAHIWTLWRVLVLVAWGMPAALIVVTTDRQARQLDMAMGELDRRRQQDRRMAGETAIELLLRGSVLKTLHHLDIDVYLPTKYMRVCVKYSTKIPLVAVDWEYSRGATGIAFAEGKRVYASDEEARRDAYLLPEKLRAEASHLAVVVAVPIKNKNQRTIGVLTAYGDTNDAWIDEKEGRNEHQALAVAIGRLLIDVCRLEYDDDV
ncbi:MAG: GAF domain-containing protein [Actinobacteria bacterium]|nr:GAF domain-containing protein [Actinomycetota bacterium]